jgi:hypothetical protein
MSQFYDISGSTYILPSSVSATVIAYTSKPSEFDLFVDDPELQIMTNGLIMEPRTVKRGTLKEFRTKLHEIVPQMNKLTHDEIESLIDERNEDI